MYVVDASTIPVNLGVNPSLTITALVHAHVELKLVDRSHYRRFQPLSYQAATSSLSPAEIAVPLQPISRRELRVRILMGEATRFDLQRREVLVGLPIAEASQVPVRGACAPVHMCDASASGLVRARLDTMRRPGLALLRLPSPYALTPCPTLARGSPQPNLDLLKGNASGQNDPNSRQR
ncbi:MAG: hypothetical protein ACLP8S_02275 [Solirubrobacteraceae bacterium]